MNPIYKLTTFLCAIIMSVGVVACQSNPSSQSVGQNTTINNPSISNQSGETTQPKTSNNVITPVAPWANTAINNRETDAVYRQEWAKAESKALCPILALPKQAAAHLTGHSVRRANFSGGWGVAYDLPTQRSAYGVANAGTTNPSETFNNWPYNVVYKDGSQLGYGHEGGVPSANWLAYIVIPQNNCFYNVWSAQSKAHLEQVITDLRLVNMP